MMIVLSFQISDIESEWKRRNVDQVLLSMGILTNINVVNEDVGRL